MLQPLPTASMSIGKLFRETHQLSVPIYQRPFSWSVDEAARLLVDVAYAAGIDEGQPVEPDYFLGAILLLDSSVSGGPGRLTRDFEIADEHSVW